MMNLVNEREFESTLKDLQDYVVQNTEMTNPVREAVVMVIAKMHIVLAHANQDTVLETPKHTELFDVMVQECADIRDYLYDCLSRGETVNAIELYTMAYRMAANATSFRNTQSIPTPVA